MLRGFISILIILCTIGSYAQVVRLHEEVTTVPMVAGKVVFMKEIPPKSGSTIDGSYSMMKDWARDSYGKDPFVSSVRYDAPRYEFIAKSRIELLLPANRQGIREKFTMRYRANGYVFADRCVLEITEISYLYNGARGEMSKSLPKVIRAEDFITDGAINKNDDLKEMKANTQKSTLFFINQLMANFEAAFAY